MTDDEILLAELACARLCTKFHVSVDQYDHDTIVALFAEDATWEHLSGRLKGPDDFRRYLDSKSTYPIVRHVISNILIDVIDPDNAAGTAYVTVYYAEPTAQATPMIDGPALLVQYHDQFRRTAQGWRFSYRRPEIIFKTPVFTRFINTKADEARVRGRAKS
jgi:hypothetical protein